MTVEGIREKLFELQDEKYRDFQQGLIPSVEQKEFIGIRTPALRKLAKELYKAGELDEFFRDLPHKYFDENQLHAFAISEIKDFDECMKALEEFLPFVDNWATSDQMSPKVFAKHKAELAEHIGKWISSGRTYSIRFAVGMLMQHYLDDAYDPSYPETVSKLRSGEYYVNMMKAWYFATALAKRYDEILPYIKDRKLDEWTHNKAIQKAVESYRITPEQKEYLKSLKIRKQGR